ncbi:MAG: DUF4886 domain-containing protein [Acholeplasmataceae bacterium]
MKKILFLMFSILALFLPFVSAYANEDNLTIDESPSVMNKRNSNVLLGNFFDTYATGSIKSSSKDGINLKFASSPERMTYLNKSTIDGLEIDILNFNSNDNNGGIAFTLTSTEGHFYGKNTVGLYFRLFIRNNDTYLLIKKADKSDNDSDFLLLESTKLSGFNGLIPEVVRFKFSIKDFIINLNLNGISIDLDKTDFLNYVETNEPLITFGSYLESSNNVINYDVTYVGNELDNSYSALDKDMDETIQVLAIGNSFSVDAGAFLSDISRASNINLVLGIASVGGSTLEDHWNNISNNSDSYTYYLNNEPNKRGLNLDYILADRNWDFVVLQQASHFSGLWDTYIPYIENIATYVRNKLPNAKILIHQTWAYEVNTLHSGFSNYGNSQEIMTQAIKNSNNQAYELINAYKLIPSGDSFYLARENQEFDPKRQGHQLTLKTDGYHASYLHGRYLIAATWFETITELSILDNELTVNGISPDELSILKNSAHQSVLNEKNRVEDKEEPENPDLEDDGGNIDDNEESQESNDNNLGIYIAISVVFFLVIVISITLVILIFKRK